MHASATRPHFHVLDGLRGTAALSVVVFHLLEMLVPSLQQNPMPHTFLAVDFFFALSGFVVGHAYDARLAPGAAPDLRLSRRGFFARRLIRLHPMVVAAMVIGIVAYLLDPWVGSAQRVGEKLSLGMLLLTFAMSLLLLPTPTLPNYFGETHSVNGPSWTLFQEYVANVLYALFAPRLGRRLHIGLCVLSALALLCTAQVYGNLGFGWGWDHWWVAPIRLACPFLLGLLVCRMKLKLRLRLPYLVLSLVLLGTFMAPVLGGLNGLYEAACVIVVFPLVLMAGAGSAEPEGAAGHVCRLAGELSYPVYIVHYPFIYLFAHWNWSTHPGKPLLTAMAVILVFGVLLLAYALLRWYDRPLRAWLSQACLARGPATTKVPALVPCFLLFAVAVLAPFTDATAQPLPAQRASLHSSILDEDRAIQVLVPEGYKPGSTDRYDVLYLLDGDGNLDLVSTIQRFVQAESYMPPLILVAVHNNVRERDLMPTHMAAMPSSGGAGKFLAFLKNELIPYIDKSYPSSGHNILYGHSAGGLFAMYALLNEPQLFNAYVAIDPSFWWDAGYVNKLAAEKLGPQQSGKSIFMAGRDEEGLRQMGMTDMDAVLKSSAPKDLSWKIASYPNETHGSVRFKGIYDGLKFLYDGYASRPVEFHPMSGIVLEDTPYKVYYVGPPQAVRYTTDGSRPSPSSMKMEAETSLVNGVKLAAMSVDRQDRFNKATLGEFKLGKPLAAIAKPKNARPGGLHYAYYEGPWIALPDFAKLKPVQTGIAGPDFNVGKLPSHEHTACLFEGFIEIQKEGYYVFALSSDDGSRLYIGGQMLIDNDGIHDASRLKTFLVPLEQGFHPLRLEYFQLGGGAVLNLYYVVPGEDKPRLVPVPFERQYSDQ